MDPITAGIFLAFKLLVASGTIAIVVAAILKWEQILNWFQSKEHLVKCNPHNIAISLHKKLQSGSFETVYGVFNKNSNTLVECEVVQSQEVDEQIARNHYSHELAVYR